HQPHRTHVVARIAPVTASVEIPEDELLLQTEGDGRGPMRDLARQELQRPPGRLVVVEDPRAGEQAVLAAIRADYEVRVCLCDAVGRHRLERRFLRLGALAWLAEDLAGRRLIDPNRGIDCPDR